MTVLIYQDYVHNHGILHRSLAAHFGAPNVAFADADDIARGALNGTRLLVMPGGADLYYLEKLAGAGDDAIRAFVENGGHYLGICAGAYYACAEIVWAAGTRQEIAGPRGLGFYDGRATGPVPAFAADPDGPWHAAVHLTDCDAPVHYNGGPVFTEGAAEVIARFADLPDGPAAIVHCVVGRGRAVLCSVHPETDGGALAAATYAHLNPAREQQARVAAILKTQESARAEFRAGIYDLAYHGPAAEKEVAA